MAAKCNATTQTSDDRTLKCGLTKGHDGPVHEDMGGEAWGDQALPHSADATLPPAEQDTP